MKFKKITVGGTFDHLHQGHKALLKQAFERGENIYLGITTDTYILNSKVKDQNAKLQCKIQNFAERQDAVKNYLNEKSWLERVQIVPITDRFGSTLQDEHLEAIVVSPETELIATEINLIRAQQNWPALEVIVVPWVLADDRKPINSVRIRRGEIDREGKTFTFPEEWGVRRLPTSLREELSRPMGRLISDLGDLSHLQGRLLVSVGDAVTQSLLTRGVFPDISIVDLKIQRKPVFKNILEIGFRGIKVHKILKNPAGTLSFEGYNLLKSLLNEVDYPSVMQVEGEDDLLALLAVFVAPLESLIVYGQPNEGIVVVEVTESTKNKIRNLLNQFVPII